MSAALRQSQAALIERLLQGDRTALAKVLTLIDCRPADAPAIDAAIGPHTGRAGTIGITGAPGAGKSTLVGSMLKSAVRRGERAAVLALDPVSPLTRGAVLGDRLRMEHSTADDRVFVRSMTADSGAGGLALATPFAIRALDSAGWPWVIVETVGVGQSQFDIVDAVATVVVVLNPGAGDEVQAIKAGLMEMADVFALNKADREGTQAARLDIERSLHHLPLGAWRPPVIETVASEDRGTDDVWSAITAHRRHLVETGELAHREQRLLKLALRGILEATLHARVSALLAADDITALLSHLQSGESDLASVRDALLTRLLDHS